jgi:imidazolonepropionase-like amidohydrolase
LQVDWIKLAAPYTREEVTAAVDEAHMRGIPVMVDAFGEYITWAAEAGMDSIEHPLAMPEESFPAMAKNGTAFVPTAVAFHNVLHYGYPSAGIPAGGFYYTLSRRFYLSDETIRTALQRARAAGVKVGVGTDVPFENEKRYPSDYFVELRLLKDAGYTNEEILTCATRNGGEILQMDDLLGTLEKGKLADVLVVAENPLDDIQNLQTMRLLIADGRVVRNKLTGQAAATTSR